MSSNRILIYDTTLRDGTQGEGISFSVADKLRIAEKLDHFGIDYIEGGWPGSNPRDMAFFHEVRHLKLTHAKIAAFGSTRRAGIRAADDPQLKLLLEAETPVVTIFGKSWLLHVTEVLRTTPEENLAMIEDSVRFLCEAGREVIYDAEHFFDGYKDNPAYALQTLEAAARGGAVNLSLCDTNGGTMVDEVKHIVGAVVAQVGPKVGMHCHNDCGLGVAVSLVGVQAGAVLVQGTANGYGERTGNANLLTIIPNLLLKLGYEANCRPQLPKLRQLSLFVDELANLHADNHAPFVGVSAFAHKGGVHANAAHKVARSYEHIDPALVGNRQRVLISDMSGRSSVVMKARELGVELEAGSPALKDLIEEIKKLEFQGYEYEAADASFQLLIAKALEKHREFFGFEGYRVIVERRGPNEPVISEATVKLRIGDELRHTVAESNGPIGALDKALRLALEPIFPQLKEILLRDYKVRILESQQGAGARVRVLVETADGEELFGTVGAGENIIEASWQALKDALEFKLLRDEQRKAKG
ncbi:MAG: citramalate synthase [Opitutaceae bacterium]|nr:citramalate synthase [Opitutaceae bacterium]